MTQHCRCSERYNNWYRITLKIAAKQREAQRENEQLKIEILGYQKRLSLIIRVINEIKKAITGIK